MDRPETAATSRKATPLSDRKKATISVFPIAITPPEVTNMSINQAAIGK